MRIYNQINKSMKVLLMYVFIFAVEYYKSTNPQDILLLSPFIYLILSLFDIFGM